MFEQTFVDGTQKTKKPFTILLSLALQVGLIGVAILIPLIYTQTLPNAQLKSMLVAPPPPPPPPPPEKVVKVVKPIVKQFVSNQLMAPRVIPKTIDRIVESAPPPDTGVVGGVEGGATGGVIGGVIGGVPPPPPPPPPKPKAPSGPQRIGGNVMEANLLKKIQPVYPPLAKSARVQGTVEFTATISKEGNIENLQLVRGHPLLVNAAKEAVLQWKYRPTMLNGSPVEVITDIIVNFTLSQ